MNESKRTVRRSRGAALPHALIVDNLRALESLRRALQTAQRIAVDTESNSLYAYREQVCLIQITAESGDYLIDPLRFDPYKDLAFLGELLASPHIEKVLHAAEYDVMCLRRDFGFTMSNLFDTMVAARILGWERVGLADLLVKYFGTKPDKRHQLADWGRRPLSPDMLRYAQMDTHFLLRLRDELYTLLQEGDHLAEAHELFDEVCRAEWSRDEFDPDGFWRITKASQLDAQAAAVLRELYLYREEEAQQRDLPVFKVVGDSTLLQLAESQPASTEALAEVKGMTRGQVRRYAAGILAAIARGQEAPPLDRPRMNGQRPDESVIRRFDALHTWRKERAAARGVSSDIVMPKDALWEIARRGPTCLSDLEAIDSLGPWRLATYGAEVVRVLAELSAS